MKKRTLLGIVIALLAITPVVILGVLLSRQNQVPELARQFPVDLLAAHTDWQVPSEAGPALLLFYSPDCDHCQNEAEELSTHPEFKEQTIYWLSGDTPEANRSFQDTYAPEAPASFQFLEDSDYGVANALEVSMFPTIFIYDAAGHLLHRYEGETEPERILSWLD
ncbi:MAG TPA: thioredoxin family protein [Saprospiraceae bacterium]|nr:thioredoxin family protein [Saprospiraceae bacterium]